MSLKIQCREFGQLGRRKIQSHFALCIQTRS
jgi:hypothetical protein